jgi:DNA-binding CsgD family transcriptional regulator/PAS domain-containing protein
VDAELLSRLIGLVYDCAIDPGLWGNTIAIIREELAFANASLSLQELPSGKVLLNLTSGIPDEWAQRISLYDLDVLEQWGGPANALALPLDEPAVLSQVNHEVLDLANYSNRYYTEWAKPQGLIDTLAIGLTRDASSIGTLAFGRHESVGPIGPREVRFARLLVPHLQRAAAISRLLELQSVKTAQFEIVLDALATPIFLVTADLGIVHANVRGRAMLTRGDVFALRGTTLRARARGVENAIAAAVRQSTASEANLGRKGFNIPLHSTDGDHGALHVLPLKHGDRRARIGSAAVAAIFVAPIAFNGAAQDVVAGLFGLTPAEARVFHHVAAGHTTLATASLLSIEHSTVRTHLLRVFNKTGVRRQAELVKLAASLTVPVQKSVAP